MFIVTPVAQVHYGKERLANTFTYNNQYYYY